MQVVEVEDHKVEVVVLEEQVVEDLEELLEQQTLVVEQVVRDLEVLQEDQVLLLLEHQVEQVQL
jgi:hypothetical protein